MNELFYSKCRGRIQSMPARYDRIASNACTLLFALMKTIHDSVALYSMACGQSQGFIWLGLVWFKGKKLMETLNYITNAKHWNRSSRCNYCSVRNIIQRYAILVWLRMENCKQKWRRFDRNLWNSTRLDYVFIHVRVNDDQFRYEAMHITS